MSATMLWALPGLPAMAGAVLALMRPRSSRAAAVVSVAVASLTLGLAIWALAVRPRVRVPFMLGSDLGLGVDALAGVVAIMVAAVSLLVLVFAAGDVRRSAGRFHGLMLLFLAAVMTTATATTLPTLLVAWEVMGATSYALIGFAWRVPAKVSAATVAFVTTRAGDLGLYVAAGAALLTVPGLRLADLATAPDGWRTVIAAGIAVAALGKAAQLPFSFWLSGAMEAPSPVSALLHSAAMVAMGGFLLLRIQPLLATTSWVAGAVAWIGAGTALLLGVVALAQQDLKQMLAASTAAQLGFVVLAAGVGGLTAGTFQLVAHAATKALLFLVAGVWLSALGTKQLAGLRGAARRWPGIGAAATIGLLTLAGVAPMSLWASKEAVLAQALHASPALYVVGLGAAAVSAAYAGRALAVIWQPVPPDAADFLDADEPGRGRVEASMRPPLAVLAVAAAALSVLAIPPVAARLRAALGDRDAVSPTALELIGSAGLAAIVVALVWAGRRVRLPLPGWAGAWLRLQAGVDWLVVGPTDRLARRLAWFDDQVVDQAVYRVAHGGVLVARQARRLDDGGLDAAVTGTARGLRRLGQLARRPQSGQLHQYYLQSVVVLAAAALLLVLAG